MLANLTVAVIGLFGLSLLFWPLQRLCPAVPTQSAWRRDTGTDLLFWFLKPVLRTVVLLAAVPLAFALDLPADSPWLQGFGPLAGQPVWLQFLEVIVGGDFLGYWLHRGLHGRLLWKFHAVHHSSREVDWLSTVRLHPVDNVGTKALQAAALVAVGFPIWLVGGYTVVLTPYLLLLHANVSWTFGPLRFVLASPAFHRWHHTCESEGWTRISPACSRSGTSCSTRTTCPRAGCRGTWASTTIRCRTASWPSCCTLSWALQAHSTC